MTASTKKPVHILAVIVTAALLVEHAALAQDSEGSSTDSTETAGDTETSAEGKETKEEEKTEGTERKKLSDRIKSVQRKVFLKKSRVEIFPQFSLDLNDPFFQHFIVGAAVGFHLADSMSVEVRGGATIAKMKQSAIRFVRTETDSLLENPPEFKYHADIDFLWAPFYGKISLFSEAILHFDTYLTAGPGIFGTDAGLNPAANIGIGQRYFITDWLTARVEVRNYLFLDNRNDTSDLQNLLVLGFSVSGFFPMSFEYELQ
jgi:outer membrane beta-barrel protein